MVSTTNPIIKIANPKYISRLWDSIFLLVKKREKGSIMTQTAIVCNNQKRMRLTGLFLLSSNRSSVFVINIRAKR